ncbi:MAG TPA: NUDIX domain-containing protein [Candidatus Nanoarchaeia archaeon]|nr:NUDIX domain-containing protein [Candidatus Nanoarchaeia archaeon]
MKTKTINKVALLVIKNKSLLAVYKPDIRFYITPGGKIDKHESDKECAKREIYEELGCTPFNLKYFKTFKGINIDGRKIVLKCYFCKLKGKIKMNREVTEHVWINSTNKNNLPIAPLLRSRIFVELKTKELIK